MTDPLLNLADAVVALLNSSGFGDEAIASRDSAPTNKLKDLDSLRVHVVPWSMKSKRGSSGTIAAEFEVLVLLQQRLVPETSADRQTELMALAGAIHLLLQNARVTPSPVERAISPAVERDPACDPVRMRDHHLFYCCITTRWRAEWET